MGQRLYLIRKDKYRLNIKAFENIEFDKILRGDSKFNYRLSIKEKLSAGPVESYEANILNGKIGFDLKVGLDFGTYLYVIEKINLIKEVEEELAYGFFDVMPDVV